MSDNRNHEDLASSDDEKFEDAKCIEDNENIVNNVLGEHLGFESLKISADNQKEEKPEKDDEEERFADCHDDLVDDESQKDYEKTLTEEEKTANKEKAELLKVEGNTFFKGENFEKAAEMYTEALRTSPVDYANERSILYGNRAAAKVKLNAINSAIEDCSKSLEFNPKYLKVLLRRAKLYEDTNKLDESLEDYKNVLTMDPDNIEARQATIRLPPMIQERNEKLKVEMIGKLKDLGDIILKPFGLSTNNFQMQQDPNTGSYSINYNQNNTQ